MRRVTLVAGGVAAVLSLLACTAEREKVDGKAEFEARCSGCHPDGGNTINPGKTLRKVSREANGVRSVDDIVAKMRKPGPGMKQYDRDELSDAKAKAIGEYILKTFN
jgi:cytochrome c6